MDVLNIFKDEEGKENNNGERLIFVKDTQSSRRNGDSEDDSEFGFKI